MGADDRGPGVAPAGGPRRTLYAPLQGTIVKVPVDHGTAVKKGDLLAKMDSLDLDKELQKLVSQEQEAKARRGQFRAQAEKANSSRGGEYAQLKGQEQEAKIQAENRPQADRGIIKEQLDTVEVRSPQDGVVTTQGAAEDAPGAARSRSARSCFRWRRPAATG